MIGKSSGSSHLWEGYALYSLKWYDESKGFGVAQIVTDLQNENIRFRSVFVHSANLCTPIPSALGEYDLIVIESIDEIHDKIQASKWHGLDSTEASTKLVEWLLDNKKYTLVSKFLIHCNSNMDYSSFYAVFSKYASQDFSINKADNIGIDYFGVLREIQGTIESKRNPSIVALIVSLTNPYVQQLSAEKRKELYLSHKVTIGQISTDELLDYGHDFNVDLSHFTQRIDVLESIIRYRVDFLSKTSDIKELEKFLNQYYALKMSVESCQEIVEHLAMNKLSHELVDMHIKWDKDVDAQDSNIVDGIEGIYHELYRYSSLNRECIDIVLKGIKEIFKNKILPLKAQIIAYSYGLTDSDLLEDCQDFESFSSNTALLIRQSIHPFTQESLLRIVNALIDINKRTEALELIDKLEDENKLSVLKRIAVLTADSFSLGCFLKLCSNYNTFDEQFKTIVRKIARYGYRTYIEELIQSNDDIGHKYDESSIYYLINNIPNVFGNEFTLAIRDIISKLVSAKSIGLYIEGCELGIIQFRGWENISDFSGLTTSNVTYVFENICKTDEDRRRFISLLSENSYNGIALTSALEFGYKDLIEREEQIAYTNLSDDSYGKLWIEGKVHSFSPSKIASYLRSIKEGIAIEDCLKIVQRRVNVSELKQVLELFIGQNLFENRTSFQNLIRSYHCIQKNGDNNLYSIPQGIKDTIEWLFEDGQVFSPDDIMGLFPYLTIEQQRRAVKKYFYSCRTSNILVDLDSLKESFTPSEESIRLVGSNKDEELFDLSTRIVLAALMKFRDMGKFLDGKELFGIFWKHKDFAPKAFYHISGYFDKCAGRCYVKNYYNLFDQSIGTIEETPDGFNIAFNDGTSWDVIRDVKDSIKQIRGARYNGFLWTVPLMQREAVISLASQCKFKVTLINGNMERDNKHLRVLARKAPLYRFCDGRYVPNAIDEEVWCSGEYCHKCLVKVHEVSDWENYSMYDFCHILGYDLTEYSKYYPIQDGLYMQFVGTVNWLNIAIEHFYCRSCHNFLEPNRISEYARHSVVRYSCNDPSCPNFRIPVYINTCLNRDCRNIIDSRDSKQCPNGLYICNKCGQCCSHDSFVRRLNTLKEVGGYIPEDLEYKINNHLGHREKNIYFCYKCGTKMNREDRNYTCPNCGEELKVKKLYKNVVSLNVT